MSDQKTSKQFDRDLENAITRLRRAVRRGPKCLCPICGFEGRFGPYGLPPLLNARCPIASLSNGIVLPSFGLTGPVR